MASITREQMLKYAAGWQAAILLLTWYLNEFGIDTSNRLLFGFALVILVILLYFKQEYGKKDSDVVTPPDIASAFMKVSKYLVGGIKKQVDAEHVSEKDDSKKSIIEELEADQKW